ncbi:MAG: SatD family protein [Bacteroidales bacterium]|nr:SatD family protein [Bacteroidales bacterium]
MADVKDSRLKKGNELMSDFKSVVNEASIEYKSSFVSPITITLGDEFQSIVKTLSEGINIVFNMEEYRIYKQIDFELRYVIYQGEIDTEINTTIAHEMVGEGLANARETLQKLKKMNQNYYVYLENHTKSKYLNQLLFLYHSEAK